MRNLKNLLASGLIAAATGLGAASLSGSASAASIVEPPAGAQALQLSSEIVSSEKPMVLAQRGGRRVGGGRVGGGRVVRGGRGGRGIGGAGAAAIGLGILGGMIAAGAAQSEPRCWIERRERFNRHGQFIGYRNVRVCN